MDAAAHLAHLRADIDRVRALPGTVMDRPVPTCPEWTVTQLVEHCAGVFAFAAGNLRRGPDDELGFDVSFPEGLSGRDLFAHQADELLAALDATDPAARRPTWSGSRPAAWWYRRMACELAVHRWDAQRAAGDPEPIPVELALDGVDEAVEVYLVPQAEQRGLLGLDTTVHLHATDDGLAEGAGEWMFRFGADALEVGHEHGKGDMAGRGSASDLLLFVWNRRPVALTTFGEPDLLEWWPTNVGL